jgi:AcrR family transcriptional regulator
MAQTERARAARAQTPPAVELLSAAQLRRRERIVDAAVDLLMSRPYDKIQMRDVAGDAGVALGTLYRYFSSKEHLFAAVLLKWADRLEARVHRRPLKGATNCDRLVELFYRSARSFELAPQFFEAWRAIGGSTDPHARQITAITAERTAAIYLHAIDGIEPGDSATIVLCCQSLLNFLLNRWYSGSVDMAQVYRDLERGIHMIMEFSIDH